MKYQVGQYVYTANPIRGWFDYSVKDVLPANVLGTIIKGTETPLEPIYEVYFNKEFGSLLIRESNLKLG